MVVISDRCTLPARQNLVLHQGWSAGQWHQWDKRRWNHLPGSPSHRALCRAEGMSLRWRVTVIQQSKLETNRICRFLQQGLGNFNSWLCFAVALGANRGTTSCAQLSEPVQKDANSALMNCGPLSVRRVSGIPCRANWTEETATTVAANVSGRRSTSKKSE